MRIRFVSGNPHKSAEVVGELFALGVEALAVDLSVEERQTTDLDALVRDKCLAAFSRLGRPVLVEHTGLRLAALNGLPGGLTSIFWNALQADRFCELFGREGGNGVEATSVLGYCDGRRIRTFAGSVRGTVPPSPRGDRSFQWDCAFVPEGGTATLAELGPDKGIHFVRRGILGELAAHVSEARP